MRKKSIHQQLAEKTFKELGFDPKTGKPLSSPNQSPNSSYSPPNKKSHTPPFRIKDLEKTARQSSSGKTYKYSAVYRNSVILRLLIKKFTDSLNPKKHHRLISQLDSAARSVVANIREGYVRPKSSDYSTFLGYSQGSLEEVRGDIEDAKDDGLIKSKPDSNLKSLDIFLKPPPNVSPSDHLRELKRKIREIKSEDLTCEIFIEIINKTDWLLKRTVEGLDKKIISDEKQKLKKEISSHFRKHW
ncbi:MAG: four helix bundle protein [Candidatus Sifarchaeia archaeon]|jgi:four helix bundle protein